MRYITKFVSGFLKKEEGVTAVECALMFALVVVICIVAINQINPSSSVGQPIVVQATLDVANVIILESVLSFLGFGVQPPTASWGNMLANSQENFTIAWWAAVYPGLCIFVTVLAINYMGDGLRDALDPNVR